MPLAVADTIGVQNEGADASKTAQDVLHIVVAENQAAQRAIARDVLLHEVFPNTSLEIHEAANGVEARRIIDTLIAENRGDIFLLTDLHMDERGNDPERNGDSLIAGLVRDKVHIPLAVASGTIALQRARLLQEGHGGIPFLNKDAFSTVAPRDERTILIERIRNIAQGQPPSPITVPQLAYLRRVTQEAMNVPGMHLLIDAIKSETRKILQNHRETINHIDGSAILDVHGLYDGDASLNVHEYKNALQLFIERVRRTHAHTHAVLLQDLTFLQSFINDAYRSLRNEEKTVEVITTLQSLCTRIMELSGRNITCATKIAELRMPGNPVALYHILTTILQNALAHGNGDIEVEVMDNGLIRVWNATESDLSFAIMNGKVTEGELPKTSTSRSGSGTGIRALLQLCEAQHLKVSMYPYNGGVTTTLPTGVKGTVKKQYLTDAPTREPTVPFGIIGFICHDGKPQHTFEENEKNCPSVFAVRYLEFSQNLAFPGDEVIPPFFEECVKKYDFAFSQMSICFLHMSIIGCHRLIAPLQQRYPHITFCPVTHEPSGMKKIAEEWIAGGSSFQEHMLLPGAIESHIAAGDPASAEEVNREFFRTDFSGNVLTTLARIAQRLALKRSEEKGDGTATEV